MSDFRTCGCTGDFGCFICDVRGQRPRAKLPLRSATPEELTAQAESRGENYKPGPRQATPFIPEPMCGNKSDHFGLSCTLERDHGGNCYDELSSVGKNCNAGVWNPPAPPTLPVPERTAEMEELMVRESPEEAFRRGQELMRYNASRVATRYGSLIESKDVAEYPLFDYRAVDHIEGKG